MKKEVFPVRTECCTNCRYSDRDRSGVTLCRRHPPQVTVIPMPAQAVPGMRGPAIQPVPVSAWPPVDEPTSAWCGDWAGTLGSAS